MADQEEYELTKQDHKCAFDILRESGRWTSSQIRKMLREPRGLRDDFAMAALPGVMSRSSSSRSTEIAIDAYMIADSMMKRREE